MQQVERDSPDCSNLSLARWRRKKTLSLEQISQSTKISVRALQAIEAEEFKKLPGGIYSTSYIRQYARAIEFDESRILTLYYSVMGISPESEDGARKPSDAEGGLVSRFLRNTSAVLGSIT
jgi:cytoskeletal protein RodZ